MKLWRSKHPLILASQSRARQALLINAGIEFEAVPADIDERAVQQASRLSAPGEIAVADRAVHRVNLPAVMPVTLDEP
jgi:septum formation protein